MTKIIESKKISDILNHVEEGTLAVFDIDNTLIDTVQNFGGYAWSCHVTKKLQEKGFEFPDALIRSYAILEQMLGFVDFKVIEPETSGVVKKLQERGISSMALTARMSSMADITCSSLQSVGIRFFDPAVFDQKIEFSPTASYEKGIFYTGPEMRKGDSLVSFFEKTGYTPEKVVFIDDSKHHAEDVYKILHAKNISVTCLRYGATDAREAAFDPARSEKELIGAIGREQYDSIFRELL